MAWPNVYSLDTRQLERRPTARPRPTILIAHDAFHIPAHFEQLQRDLANAGFRVIIPQLPSSGVSAQSATLEDDVDAVMALGKAEIDNGTNVVLVAHGYGSIPGCAAAERLNQHSLDRPRTGNVTKLVLIAGVVSRLNESYYDSVEAAWAIARVSQPKNLAYKFKIDG